jgi:8-oxo-dGTP pyrophosphatase MutT (NUDIX family)
VTGVLAVPPALNLAGAVDTTRLSLVLTRDPGVEPLPGQPRAAVLVPLVENPAGVLLTRRASHLRRHAGQVAFPGGRIDCTDASPEAAALREAEEEIGLCAADVELLGRLPALVIGLGYHVTPVVGRVRGSPSLHPAEDEVACIFMLPMNVLRDPSAPIRSQAVLNGAPRDFWVWPHHEEYIWGGTAAILVELAAALTAAA